MKQILKICPSLLLLLIAFSACNDVTYYGQDRPATNPPVDPPVQSEASFIYLDYWNPDGDTPQIELDSLLTSSNISIDPTMAWQAEILGSDSVIISLRNINVTKDAEIRSITGITPEEQLGNNWISTTEFSIDYTVIDLLNVTLALDVSASLRNDLDSLKAYASRFIYQVKSVAPNAQLGIVAFSTDITTHPLTVDLSPLMDCINQLTSGQFTTLYDGMDQAIAMLYRSQADVKALITFTDGHDNNSSPHTTPELLIQHLQTPDRHLRQIKSYVIGLKGNDGIEESTLKSLAVNQGISTFPENLAELSTAFEQLSHMVASNYDITYIRNRQVIPETSKRKIRLNIATSTD